MNFNELTKSRTEESAMRSLGIEVIEATKDKVVLEMEVTPKVHQYSGILHGGVSLVIAESAASIGAALNYDLTRFSPVGIEINANHLRSVKKGKVIAEARPVYLGRTLSVWQVEIKDERGKLVCISRCTLAIKKGGAF